MEMTDEEIVYRYRNASIRNRQIQILADLNGCTKDDIMEVLIRKGEELPTRKYPRRDKPTVELKNLKEEQTEEKEPEKTDNVQVPEFIAKVLILRMDELDGMIGDIDRQKKEYEHEYIEIAKFLGIRKE